MATCEEKIAHFKDKNSQFGNLCIPNMNKYAFWDIKWEDMEVLVDLSYNKTQKWLIVAIFRPKLDKIEGVPWQKN